MVQTDAPSDGGRKNNRGRPKGSTNKAARNPNSKEDERKAKHSREEMLLTGNSEISRLADYYRSEKLEPGYWYVDPAFEYREETLTIWCRSDFLNRPKFNHEISRKVRRMPTLPRVKRVDFEKKMAKFNEKMEGLLRNIGGVKNKNVIAHKTKVKRAAKKPAKLR
mmetsp:Transcript_21191/g.39817  ORF Transcript_21191/g.39817 Transcript_21191/m.39817 type:complete len:165 (+) Transcript_21191:133-627(+)